MTNSIKLNKTQRTHMYSKSQNINSNLGYLFNRSEDIDNMVLDKEFDRISELEENIEEYKEDLDTLFARLSN